VSSLIRRQDWISNPPCWTIPLAIQIFFPAFFEPLKSTP
jgi:hypothetical protein